MAAKAKSTSTEINVPTLRRGAIKLRIIGETPLIQNRMANKVRGVLLTGGKRKTKAEREDIKHNPYEEFLASAEPYEGPEAAIGLKVTAIKGAMANAALETPGVTKASAQRLIFMPQEVVPVYGVPYLRMDVVRSADINRTPDIRSRVFLPRWCAEVEIHYIIPQLSTTAIVNLLCNAGVVAGVGDFRQEKGKGNFGSFRVISADEDDPEWDDLVANEARKVQEAALAAPEYANQETADLMAIYEAEVSRRKDVVVAPAKLKVSKARTSKRRPNGTSTSATL